MEKSPRTGYQAMPDYNDEFASDGTVELWDSNKGYGRIRDTFDGVLYQLHFSEFIINPTITICHPDGVWIRWHIKKNTKVIYYRDNDSYGPIARRVCIGIKNDDEKWMRLTVNYEVISCKDCEKIRAKRYNN